MQAARGHTLCRAMGEGVVGDIHEGWQQELDASLLRIGIKL